MSGRGSKVAPWFDPGFWEESRYPAGDMVRDLFRTEMAAAYRIAGPAEIRPLPLR